MDKLPELKDHFLIQFILGKLVNYLCRCELVERNSIEEMSEYPFVTFNWITPVAPTTSDWLKDHPQYVCTMQIDVHATTTTEAMDLSLKLFNALHESNFVRSFHQAQIVPQRITNTSNRTALSGINYDNDYGFDCSFLINSGFVFKESDLRFDYIDTTIESVKLASNIRVTQNGVANN
ncbi:MAG: hypothetical protein J6586_00185 [Snodgrassella sp.]|nr:hypothetical protein [Snodgrassella sp.]